MISPEEVEHLNQLLTVLRAAGVTRCTLDGMSFELGPIYRSPTIGAIDFAMGESPEDKALRQKKELEELLYASSGG